MLCRHLQNEPVYSTDAVSITRQRQPKLLLRTGALRLSGKFRKGTSGNPGGRPKALRPVVEAARALAPEAITVLAAIMRDRDAPHAARIAATNAILDRGFGKAPQIVALDDEGEEPQILKIEFVAPTLDG